MGVLWMQLKYNAFLFLLQFAMQRILDLKELDLVASLKLRSKNKLFPTEA